MNNTQVSNPPSGTDIDLLKLEVERDKLAVERDKLAVEREKLAVERYKAKFVFWSITLPVVATAIALGFNGWAARQAARSQFQLQAAKYLTQVATYTKA